MNEPTKFHISIKEHLKLFEKLHIVSENYQNLVKEFKETLNNGNKIIVAGNGGSATDAQHFAAELVGRFEKERKGLPAIDITSNASSITSIGNDYNFESVFSRQISALGKKGDLLLVISTSGNSKNIINAVKTAKLMGIKSCGLLGKGGGLVQNELEISIVIPHSKTSRIQEAQLFILHTLCGEIDDFFIKNNE